MSHKTGTELPRRAGAAKALVVPLAPHQHDHLHQIGESAFERENGKPEGWLLGYAAGLLGAFITGADS